MSTYTHTSGILLGQGRIAFRSGDSSFNVEIFTNLIEGMEVTALYVTNSSDTVEAVVEVLHGGFSLFGKQTIATSQAKSFFTDQVQGIYLGKDDAISLTLGAINQTVEYSLYGIPTDLFDPRER